MIDAALRAAVDLLGRSTAVLLFDSGWMHRRTDAVELINDAWVRQTTTVDLSIPRALKPMTPADDGVPAQYVVPIGLLPRVHPGLMRFDFRCDGQELTRPTRRQSGWAAYAALLWAASSTIGTWPLRDDLREQLMFIAIGPPEYAAPVSSYLRAPRKGLPLLSMLPELPALGEVDAALVAWCEQLAGGPLSLLDGNEDETDPDRDAAARVAALSLSELNDMLARDDLSSWLLRKLATSSPVLAHVPRAASGRQMITLSYDENLFKPQLDVGKSMAARNGWLAYPYVNHAIYIGASSYHFELIAPTGVDVVHSQLIDQPPSEDEWDPEYLSTVADTAASQPTEDGGGSEATATDKAAESQPDVPARGPFSDENEYEAGRPKYDYVPIRGERIHLYRVDEDVVADALHARVELRAVRTGFIGGAALATCAIAGLLAICAIATEPLISHGVGAPALLLLLPGLMATLVARADGHALTIRFLQGARRTLLLSGVVAFIGAGMLALIKTGDGAHARVWHHVWFGLLAALAVWQAFKLLVARTLPRPPERHGLLEKQVGRVRRRAEKRALGKARRRQRSLQLRVTGADLRDWKRAEALTADLPVKMQLRLKPGPVRSWLQEQNVAVDIVAAEDHEQPLLRPTARPNDDYLAQDLSMMRALAGVLRWLGEQLPSGYNLEIRWASRTRKAWNVCRYLSRNLFGLLAGKATSQLRLPLMPERSVTEVAAAARRGGLRMRCVHIVVPPPETKPVTGARKDDRVCAPTPGERVAGP